jgi:sporulation protein YlmC with PRC-barrel domain
MRYHEAHVERLLGRRVHDDRGQVLGRIEEMFVEVIDGEYVVTEFHLGRGALVERIAGFVRQLPFFTLVARKPEPIRVEWQRMDLSDPTRPVVRDVSARS